MVTLFLHYAYIMHSRADCVQLLPAFVWQCALTSLVSQEVLLRQTDNYWTKSESCPAENTNVLHMHCIS